MVSWAAGSGSAVDGWCCVGAEEISRRSSHAGVRRLAACSTLRPMARSLAFVPRRIAAVAAPIVALVGATSLTLATDGLLVEIAWSVIAYVVLGFGLDLRDYAKRRRPPDTEYDRHVGCARRLASDFEEPGGARRCLVALARSDDAEDQMQNCAVPFLLETQRETFVVHGTQRRDQVARRPRLHQRSPCGRADRARHRGRRHRDPLGASSPRCDRREPPVRPDPARPVSVTHVAGLICHPSSRWTGGWVVRG